jgi:hypothetical protein
MLYRAKAILFIAIMYFLNQFLQPIKKKIILTKIFIEQIRIKTLNYRLNFLKKIKCKEISD